MIESTFCMHNSFKENPIHYIRMSKFEYLNLRFKFSLMDSDIFSMLDYYLVL
ncbi:hypothetical protein SAMN02745163_00922 [Clostridium cavendishii DSM 21758]|uniref:Uncharacterized protein n=1 Tax=Clostridium cavendishii DSM 21758 TaxID=1121302 RepID=A0A1M6ERD5_9CLOT|nr:hypothetical protein SAMN02745163_00922 [Clostridium cavendishii DSM 21758]